MQFNGDGGGGGDCGNRRTVIRQFPSGGLGSVDWMVFLLLYLWKSAEASFFRTDKRMTAMNVTFNTIYPRCETNAGKFRRNYR